MDVVGQVGDFIAGAVGTLFSLSSVILIYITYHSQKNELNETRKLLLEQEVSNNFNYWVTLYRNFVIDSKVEIKGTPFYGTSKIIQEINRRLQDPIVYAEIGIITKDELFGIGISNLNSMKEIHPFLKSWIYLLNVAISDLYWRIHKLRVENKFYYYVL
ncbi:MAG: hypothetical protein IPL95_16330 [Saprospiraceae bacterium]|nr:hypothetical protein [Saprospiraceae bacterium]